MRDEGRGRSEAVEPCSDDYDGAIDVVSEYSHDPVTGHSSANWIATCDLQDDRIDENHANARLIAAAPELLATLKGLVDLLNDDLDPDQCAAWDAAVAAITKAEGQS